ncbi:TATA binding protein of transcription factor IID (nucleomorph) [Chroomonas mesostigmatica CCMP1168]|uniref:General transcription factor TFIIB n=1 Tax=Chroomonas mesostigmatica CCMP1168 TaxID=1195612 RepID=J7GA43_9CRYP|nr:TATA binding protein of transcription factor IID [Chroomonas mesostigmatica CCMP1168]|mmetsp:Transcript_38510/g.94733  ORF Transcript_38510/g.94733 Transcript_38510/m.94733 type:complete len:344 (+) Transcript_38510:647-1678(+)
MENENSKKRIPFRLVSSFERCIECGSENLLEDMKQGDIVCKECGMVLTGHIVDFTSEWRIFSEDNKKSDPIRIGDPLHELLEKNPGTLISKGLKGSNILNEKLLKTQNRGTVQKTDRFLTQVFSKIGLFLEKICLFMGIKKRVEEFFKLYFDYLTLRTDGTRSRYSLRKNETVSSIAASIFIVSRNEKIPRTFKEISEATGVSKKALSARVRAIERSLRGTNISKLHNTDDFVSRFCSKLGLPSFVSDLSKKLAKFMKDQEGLYGRNYISVSAASILLVTQLTNLNLKCPPKKIASAAGISEITLNIAYKSMYPHREKILDYLFLNFPTNQRIDNNRSHFLQN